MLLILINILEYNDFISAETKTPRTIHRTNNITSVYSSDFKLPK